MCRVQIRDGNNSLSTLSGDHRTSTAVTRYENDTPSRTECVLLLKQKAWETGLRKNDRKESGPRGERPSPWLCGGLSSGRTRFVLGAAGQCNWGQNEVLGRKICLGPQQ